MVPSCWHATGFETRAESLAAEASYFHRPEVIRKIDACAAKWRGAGEPRLIGRGITLRHWLVLANYLAEHDRESTNAWLVQTGPYLGNTAAYGYFWMRQTESFHARLEMGQMNKDVGPRASGRSRLIATSFVWLPSAAFDGVVIVPNKCGAVSRRRG